MSLETQTDLVLQQGQTHQMSIGEAMDAYKRNTNWWAVYAAFDLPDFTASPKWISQKTGVDVAEVVEALDGLVLIGKLRKEQGAFYPVKGENHVRLDNSQKTRSQIIDEHALVSLQMLNHLDGTSKVAFDHRCFAANLDILKELYSEINAAFEKAFEKSQSNPKANDGIYKMTFTAVDTVQHATTTQGGN